MKHAVARLFEPLLRFLNTRSRRRHPQKWDAAPYACSRTFRLAVHRVEVAA